MATYHKGKHLGPSDLRRRLSRHLNCILLPVVALASPGRSALNGSELEDVLVLSFGFALASPCRCAVDGPDGEDVFVLGLSGALAPPCRCAVDGPDGEDVLLLSFGFTLAPCDDCCRVARGVDCVGVASSWSLCLISIVSSKSSICGGQRTIGAPLPTATKAPTAKTEMNRYCMFDSCLC